MANRAEPLCDLTWTDGGVPVYVLAAPCQGTLIEVRAGINADVRAPARAYDVRQSQEETRQG